MAHRRLNYPEIVERIKTTLGGGSDEEISLKLARKSRQTLYEWRKGNGLRLATLEAIAEQYSKSLEWLLFGDDVLPGNYEWLLSSLDEYDRATINDLATRSGRAVSDQIRQLVHNGLYDLYIRMGYKVVPGQKARLYPPDERERDSRELDRLMNASQYEGFSEHGRTTELLQKVTSRDREDAWARIEIEQAHKSGEQVESENNIIASNTDAGQQENSSVNHNTGTSAQNKRLKEPGEYSSPHHKDKRTNQG